VQFGFNFLKLPGFFMPAAFERAFVRTLKAAYRLDHDVARHRYNELGSVLFLGVGLVALIALLLVPGFSLKGIVYAYTAYCFFVPAFIKLRPPGFSLSFSLVQIPAGIAMIISLQAVIPLDMLYMTAFLYPIVFIFAYEFHRHSYVRWTLAVAATGTAAIVVWRDLAYWQAYLVTTFGSTLIIGRVVDRASQRVLELANRDALTGLINRRHWEETLDHLVNLAQRDGQPVSLAFLDLDDFKSVNDEQGHAAGDALLQSVAEHMKHLCRDSDLLARWGGDEFAIAMPHASKEQAQLLVRRLRENLNETGISVGIVTLREDESMSELLNRADQAMYHEKSLRREAIEKTADEMP
jgi:diguanylate cyclase (GGDEF)-like protein